MLNEGGNVLLWEMVTFDVLGLSTMVVVATTFAVGLQALGASGPPGSGGLAGYRRA